MLIRPASFAVGLTAVAYGCMGIRGVIRQLPATMPPIPKFFTFMKTIFSTFFLLSFLMYPLALQAGEPVSGKAPQISTAADTCSECGRAECLNCPHCNSRPDAHAPIGVMGDHLHAAGEGMLSYRYMRMDMGPNYVGDDRVSARSFIGPPPTPFQIAPLSMRTEMHMIGAMYAPTDDLTLSFMLPVLDKKMDHLVATGATFSTHTHGIGDFKFGGLVKLFENGNAKTHLNLMLSAPTGSIEETGFVPPAGRVLRLPYPMQLGSGTWDLLPGITYVDYEGNLSWGAQLTGTLRLGENDANYTLGDEITATAWTAYRVSESLSASLRVSGKTWDDIDGSDPMIMGPVPTANPDLRGGSRLDVFGGVNYLFKGGLLDGHRLAAEIGKPVYQDLDGPQLGMDWMFQLGWQKSF